MATFRKKGNVWEAQVAKLGVRKSKSFHTKAEAQSWATTTEAAIVAGKNTSVADKTFGDLLTRYMNEVTPTKRGARAESLRILRFLQDPIAMEHLRDLDTTHFAAWRDRRLSVVSPASVLRERNTLSNVCKRATEEWKWLPKHPMKGVSMPSKPDHRDVRILPHEQEALMHAFGDNLDTVIGRVGHVFLFALETGMRAGEIADLKWPSVNLGKRTCTVLGGKTQAARRDVPLSTAAVRLLEHIRDSRTANTVFDVNPAQIDSHFRKAKARALVPHLHFHDTRHEAITRLAQKIPLLDLARMVGHRDLRTLQVYYNATAEEIAQRLD